MIAPPTRGSRLGRGLAALLLICAALALAAAPASAKWGSPVSFNGFSGGGGASPRPMGVSVDQASGDLFVANSGGGRALAGIFAFNPDHALIAEVTPYPNFAHFDGVAFDPASGDLYAVETWQENVLVEPRIDTYDPATGNLLSSFSVLGAGNISNCGNAATENRCLDVQIAADASGNVYLPNAPHNEVQVFDSEGNAPSGGVAATIAGEGEHALKAPTGVAVDPAGNVWVADAGNNRIEEFNPNGEFVKAIEGTDGVSALTVDASGDVFASLIPESGAHILEFNAAGTQIDDFGLGTLGEQRFGGNGELIPNAVALDEANGIFYVADWANDVVWAFSPIGVETRAATEVTTTSATLNGAVNPLESEVTSCEFEYSENGKAGSYDKTVPCEQTVGSGNEPVAVSAHLSGIETDALIHFRLHAANTLGRAKGADQKFIAIEGVFGFQLGGPFAAAMNVSKSADPAEPAAANPDPAALDTQAGSHPFDFTSRFVVNTDSNAFVRPDLRPKDFYVDVPAGFAGSVAKVKRCKMSELSELIVWQTQTGCPTASQVGVVRVLFGETSGGEGVKETQLLPVYNMVPPPGVPAEFAFPYIDVGIPIFFHVRSDGDYGITAEVPNISETLPALGSQLTLWGVPADPRHDKERFRPRAPYPGKLGGAPLPAETPEVPLLTNPTRCGEQPEATVMGDSWLEPGKLGPNGRPVPGGEGWASFKKKMFPEGITGCNKLIFKPELIARPTTNIADAPSGLHVDLHVPQNEEPDKLATPSLRDATVTLPAGVTVNPSQAAGLGACSAAQIGLTSEPGQTPTHMTNAPANCPDAAKLGKVEVDTPALPNPLKGAVYLAKPYENPFESLIAIYIAVEGEGVVVKLAGQVELNPETGQLTTTFKENPQLPFEDFKLDFFGGARAPLRTPAVCGKYETTSSLTPYSAPESGLPAKPADPYEISEGPGGGTCPASEAEEPNKPSLRAGTEPPLAGAFSPFALKLTREDGSQELARIETTLPPGLLGKLAGTTYCPDSALEAAEAKSGQEEQQTPSCPASSEVGTVNVAAGAGPSPYYVQGTAYLAGPYRGAPLSLAIVTPAVAGPFDLGTVLVRNALYVNPETAQITAKSDPIPHALQGIVLDVRTVTLKLSRPEFTLNPTNCNELGFTGSALSVLGQSAPLAQRFQVGGCAALPFHPKLKLSLRGKTRRAGHPALKAVLTMKPGEANIARAAVTLPHSEFLDQGHLNNICTRVQFAEGNVPGERCPPASIYGFARAFSPLLEKPVEGPVYLRASSHKLPDLVAALNGQIDVALDGRIDSINGGIRNSFEVVPDAPVSRFELSMQGGHKGLLVNSTDICASTNLATADFTAQNGKVDDFEPVLKAHCPRHRKRGRRNH